jgi:hypothetical protein
MFNVRLKPITNFADWLTAIQMTERSTGELLDLTGGDVPLTWTLEVRLQGGRWLRPWIKTDSSDGSGQLTVAALGVLQIFIPAAVMEGLEPGSYGMSLTVTNGVFTRQIFTGLLPIVGQHVSIAPGYGLGIYG